MKDDNRVDMCRVISVSDRDSRPCTGQGVTNVTYSSSTVRGYGRSSEEERSLMSLKGKLLATTAALTLAGTVGAVGTIAATAANAATSPCGRSCIDIYSRLFGTHVSPDFVLAVSG